MHEDRIIGARLRKRVGHVALFVALAVVPVLAFNSLATAATASDGGSDPTGARPGISDAQRQCLAGQGITLPTPGSDGTPRLTREQRQQFREASQACGLRGQRARPFGRTTAGGLARGLTDAQRQCLAGQGVTLGERGAESRDALRQAAEACGLPTRGHHVGLGSI